MRRLVAAFGALLGVLLVPVALVGPTAWLVPPAHLAFAVTAVVGALLEGLSGHPHGARIWGALYLVASTAMVAALELGSGVEGRAYWMVPWIVVLIWGWVPPIVAGLAGWAGEGVQSWRSANAVRHRQRARVRTPIGGPADP